MRSNMEIKLNNFMKVGMNIAPSLSFTEGPEANGRGGTGAAVAGTAPIQEYGVGDHSGVAGSSAYRWAADQVSPVYYNEQVLNKTQLTKLISNVYTNITLYKGLSLNLTGAWNSSSSDNKYYLPTSVSSSRRTAAPGSLSSATRATSRTQYYTFQSVVNYDHTFGAHQVSVIAGYSAEQNNVSSTRQVNTGFTNDNLYTFDNLTSTVSTSSNTESKRTLVSYFGRGIYNYLGRYIVTASVRRDGSSRFGINNVYGTFPAASVAWRISDENFMKALPALVNDVKLRYSWGIAGNDRIGGDYPAVGLVTTTNYNFNNTLSYGYSQTSISNQILKWERTTSNNWGIDAALFNSRINLSVDYYIKKTKDLLLQTPVLYTTGFATENKNVGSVQNTGLEILLGTVNIQRKNFSWSTKFNFSTSYNKVLALANNNTPIYKGFESTVEIAVGQPLYVYKVYDAIGVYQTPESLTKNPKMSTTIIGDPIYRDVTPDGVINTLDITNAGSPIPTYYYGMSNNFTYKQFDLAVLFQGQGGNKIFSLFGRNIDRPTTGLGNYNAKAIWANRFRSVDQPGDGVTPRIDASTANVYDSRWIYDGSFYKIKNVTLGYTFKSNIIKGLNSMRAYVSIDNVWMHDHYDGGFSPEAFQYDNLSDGSSYPTTRTYSFGINIGL
jgi:TonB-linked SusC/RagA family outer membrane protein